MSDKHQLNANRVFLWLFLFTSLEVGLSYLVEYTPVSMPKWAYWGGLCSFAFMKGLLIAKEFMHLKFEGWIVKGLIAPTPLLMIVIFFVLSGDINYDKYEDGKLNRPIGSMVNKEDGQVWTYLPRRVHGELEDEGHPAESRYGTDGEHGDAGAEADHAEGAHGEEVGSH